VVGDLRMLIPLLEARNEHHLIERLKVVQGLLEKACDELLDIYTDELFHAVEKHGNIDALPNDQGHNTNERAPGPYLSADGETYEQITERLREYIRNDAARAARYETRR